MKKFFSLFFVILLTAPVVLWLVSHLFGNTDNTVRHGFPRPEARLLYSRGYYQAVDRWFQESLPTEKPLKFFHNWLNYRLFSTTATTGVHIGIHGWLFPGEIITPPVDPSIARQAGRRLFLKLHAAEKLITASGRRFLFTVAPGKAAIYPEYIGSGISQVVNPVYTALLDDHARHPLTGFVRLEPVLKKAKLNGINVYHQWSELWSCEGAAAAAEQLLTFQEPGRSPSINRPAVNCPAPDNNLYHLLLGETPNEKAPLAGHAAGPFAVTGPVAVVYGDNYLNRLLPFITHAFNAVEIVDSTREPTFDREVITPNSDLIILQSGENRIGRINLDLESLYTGAPHLLKGMVKQIVDIEKAVPVTECALDITPDGLLIKSTGKDAFFSLPPLSGSTRNTFKMVKLTFSRAHQGRITVNALPEDMVLVQRSLNQETRHLIVPLPFNDSVTLQINPSEHPGLFTLEHAELLSFYGKNQPPKPTVPDRSPTHEDTHASVPIQTPVEPPTVEPLKHADVIPDLILTDIEQGRIFQRHGKNADIVVSGSYSGASGPVEARVVDHGSGAVVVPWSVVDGSPENGLFTGILPQIPQGGGYQLQVRSAVTPWEVKNGRTQWGVGMLVACIGQSNMREWFYSGSDHQPSPLVMLHQDGRWIKPPSTGNGGLAAGNRLTAALQIPVGLLDYSVNGSGLTAKADWGKGFWMDTGPEGIYRRWVDGVNATGGSVEYVVWMQGEADAARGTVSREEYRTGLERLVNDQIRTDIKNGSSRPQLPFLMIPLVKRPTGRDTTCQWIRDAQMDAVNTIDECHLAALSMDLENRGRQHLAPKAYTILGLRTAQTILYLLDEVPYHRGPSMSAVTRTSDRTIDISIQHRGGTDFTPLSTITGFEVRSGRQPLPIATVFREDSSTVRIELEGTLPGEFTVRYLYGAHPDTSSPIRDNTDLHLPLEPFLQLVTRKKVQNLNRFDRQNGHLWMDNR